MRPHVRPSPNIWNTPGLYELENLAADPHGRITAAMREIGDWRGRTMLDIGCGTGFHLPTVGRIGARGWSGSSRTRR